MLALMLCPLILPLPPQLPALARVPTIRRTLPPLLPVREDKFRVPKLVARDSIETASDILWKRGWAARPWLEAPASLAVFKA